MNDTKLPAPMVEFTRQIANREEMIKRALPDTVSWGEFQAVVINAVLRNRRLLDCNRATLIRACMECATDGLIPNGREAALVEHFDSRQGRAVQYQWMVAGIRKLARQSGVVRNWECFAVGVNDAFRYVLGDFPSIEHEPSLDDPGELRAVYSIVTLRTGRDLDISREVMSRAACERIRNRSQAYQAFIAGKIKSTPWETDFEQMCLKTVVKRHAKRIPMSRELQRAVERDDALFRSPEEDEEAPRRSRRKSPPPPTADEEVIDAADFEDAHADATQDDDGDDTLGQPAGEVDPKVDFEAGREAWRQGVKTCEDSDVLNNPDRLNRWRAGWTSAAEAPAN